MVEATQTKASDVTPEEAGVPEVHPKLDVLKEMLAAGVHFGHRTSRWSPKMEPYIHGVKGTVHVFNLEQTLEKLEEAEALLQHLAHEGKVVLFVGTKPPARAIVEEEAERCGMPAVTGRWLGGTLTNFATIAGRLKRLADLEEQKRQGALAKYTKQEQVRLEKEMKDLEEKFGGIKHLTRPPDALFIVDARAESTAVREAKRTGTLTVAIVDTNTDPTQVTNPIPANDDAISSVTYLVKRIADAVLRGKASHEIAPRQDLGPGNEKKA